MHHRHRPIAFAIDAEGILSGARQVPSPNVDDRPADLPIELIVIHNISLPPGEFRGNSVEMFFSNRLDPHLHPYFAQIHNVRVSAHFFVRRNGEILQFVPCLKRAWHAGVSSWRGRERCNDFSIGIELEGSDAVPFSEAQYVVLMRLIKILLARYPIGAIVGHSDIAPGRKTDPGPYFNWSRLRRQLPKIFLEKS